MGVREFLVARRLSVNVHTWLQEYRKTANCSLIQLAAGDGTELFSALNDMKNGIKVAMDLRRDTLRALKKKELADESIAKLDAHLRIWLGAVFCADSIELRRVTFDTASGQTLEKVATGDAVLQKVRSIRELKRRLDNGRRCYGLFHSSLPSDPLAFVHVALTSELAASLKHINVNAAELSAPTHAIFYSVNSPHDALSGLDLATKVIKGATGQVMHDFPSIRVLSTLSPIPGFMQWMSRGGGESKTWSLPQAHRATIQQVAASMGTAAASLSSDRDMVIWVHSRVAATADGPDGQQLVSKLQAPLTWLCAHYVAREKKRNMPLDPVARFHLRNGASLHRINWLSNSSSQGLKVSAGLMVNYLYDLKHLDERARKFGADGGAFHTSEEIDRLLAV